MALKHRVARIESSEKIAPQLGAARWWSQLLADGNELRINAALFLAFDEVIQKPPANMWRTLEKNGSGEWDKLPELFYPFAVFYQIHFCEDEEEERWAKSHFANDEGKEWLCLMATSFWEVFKTAPFPPLPESERAKFSPSRPRIVALWSLRSDFLRPIFQLIFPDQDDCRYAYFEEWLETEGEVSSLLQSIRAYMKLEVGR